MSEESTTPDLVERMRDLFELVSRGDFDAIPSFYAPDAVWDLILVGRIEGTAAIRGFLEEWLGRFVGYQIEPNEIRDFGNGVVLAVARQRARLAGGSDSAPIQEVVAYVSVWEGDKIARAASYQDIDEARAAAERLAEERE
jgi:ketosteroid isomerase-like protein